MLQLITEIEKKSSRQQTLNTISNVGPTCTEHKVKRYYGAVVIRK